MDTTLTIALIFFSLLVCLDVVATIRLVRYVNYTSRQKALQLLIIWLIPLAGAMLVVYVMSPPEPSNGASANLAAPEMAGVSAAILPFAESFPSENSDTSGHGHY